MLGWLRRRRRSRLLRRPFPHAWEEVLVGLPFVADLDPDGVLRLKKLVLVFVEDVHWEGCAGLDVTDEIRVTIAAQACRLLLGLDEEAYRHVRTILVYPSTYRHDGARSGAGGVRTEGPSARYGEAWLRGPVVLSWDASRHGVADPDDGRNTVYHEFAHKLDMLDGFADGTPPIAGRDAYEAWIRIVGREFEVLREEADRGKKSFLDAYGATNPAEFFAVATEVFFERPGKLRDRHADLYACLRDFYRQDPAAV